MSSKSQSKMLCLLLLGFPLAGASYLAELPSSFDRSLWARYSFEKTAVLPGSFNRSAFDAPCAANVTDPGVAELNEFINKTTFLAYDDRFFDLIGPDAKMSKVANLTYQNHEGACYNPGTKQLLFAEWGPPGIENHDNPMHAWQYILDTETNKLKNITTDPPIVNYHGCVVHKDVFFVVNDGSSKESAAIHKVDPHTLRSKPLINNFYEQPFNSFNDFDMDPEGNFWVSDGTSGWERDVIPSTPGGQPTVYMINGTTMRPRVIDVIDGNANGMAYWRNPEGGDDRLFMSDSGAFSGKPVNESNPLGPRSLTAWDVPEKGRVPQNRRLLTRPIEYFFDGVRVSRNGWIFGANGEGVDVLDPLTGDALGTIRLGGGPAKAVNLALGEQELWIVGAGGVWHVSGVKERLYRGW